MHGARKGTVQKVQGVRDPGYLSKRIINTALDQVISVKDCGTSDGIDLSVDNIDIPGRYLSRSVKIGGTVYGQGTVVTPSVISAARKSSKGSLQVRSPLRCQAKNGVCQKCAGISVSGEDYKIGDNLGIIAGQAIGEPSVQLSLNSFHTGGIAKGKSARSANTFQSLNNLLTMPAKLPDKATLAQRGGVVTSIKEAPQGGWNVEIGKKKHYVRADRDLRVKKGSKVKAGDPISTGAIDPRDLLDYRGSIEDVQDLMSDEIEKVLHENTSKVRRRNIETIVKSLTNLAEVDDPGDNTEWSPGDYRKISEIKHWNRVSGPKKKDVKYTPMLKGVGQMPLSASEDWMTRLNFQKLNETMERAVREGWTSDIHGFSPIPAIAYASEFDQAKNILGDKWEGQY
jgi:DNA-directed RNA polymerase subunit beta'